MSNIAFTLPRQVFKKYFSNLKCKILPHSRCWSNEFRTFRNENINEDFMEKLHFALGKEKISTALAVCKQYGTDEGCHGTSAADIVTYPHSVEDICKITRLCTMYRVPVIAHGAGSGLEHGIGAIMGGVSVDLARLNSVVELNVEDFDCTVEAGITRKTLDAYLKQTGLMFPVDPGADASIGGMASTSASGTNAVQYGTMKENVLNLEVVLADGSILHTAGPGRRARQCFDVEPRITALIFLTCGNFTSLSHQDPGADASIGGMASTSASGTNAVQYGTMKENVLILEVVLADGSILHTAGPGRRARKSAAGYNLTELFVGSEGTLGIITKVTLRLHAVPERMISAVSSFQSIQKAVSAVVEILQNNIPVARIELLDELSMAITNKYSNLNYDIAPSLFFEFHGSTDVIKTYVKQVEELLRTNYGTKFIWAVDPDARNKLWKARHEIYYATLAQKPGCKCVVTDVCVPISNLVKMVIETQEDIKNSPIFGTIIGHVGDGNFHTQLLYDPDNQEEYRTAHALQERITLRALSLNGTCTGEHGIGVGKVSHLEMEFGEAGIEAMTLIKKAFDPYNIMNPGKVLKGGYS